MKSALCFLLFAATVTGQISRRDVAFANLGSTLSEVQKVGPQRGLLSQRLADDILALAEPNRQPSRAVVASFVEELTDVLAGKQLSNRDMMELQQSIRDVVRGPSATFRSAATLRQVLSRLPIDPVKTQLITRRFMAIGEELRGPDDTGAR